MITKEQIQAIVENTIDLKEKFIVEIAVKAGNKISVAVDGYKGVTLDDCVAINRAIEGSLDREIEDFELEVSSAGLTLPFRVIEQYRKNIGKEVEVLLKTGIKINGILCSVAENGFDIENEKVVKIEGKKKKEKITERQFIQFEDIKHTKLVLIFK